MSVKIIGGGGGGLSGAGLYANLPILDGAGLVSASNIGGIANGAPTLGRLCLMPYFSGFGGVLEAIGLSTTVVAGAGGIARIGIYNAFRRPGAAGVSILVMSPSTPFFDPGVTVDTTLGPGVLFAVTGLNIVIPAKKLFWLASVYSVSAPTCRVGSAFNAMLPFNAALAGPAVSQILNGQNAAVAFPDLSAAVFNGPSNVATDAPLVFLRFKN